MDKEPFIIKYKPKSIDEFIGDDILLNKINGFIKNKYLPNLCIYGSSGVGKTCIIDCLIKKIYHPKNRDAIMDFSICNDRGMKISERLEFFNKKKIVFEEGYMQRKLIIFDDADNLSDNTQQIINASIQKYMNTSFIIICNNSQKIIESLQSRCVKLFFSNIPDNLLINKIRYICLNEDIEIKNDESILYMFNILKRDIRATYNLLELFLMNKKKINIVNTNKLLGIPSKSIYENLENYIIEKNIVKICEIINNFNVKGYNALDVLFYFINYLVYLSKIDEDKKIILLELFGNHAYVMSKTINNYIQLMAIMFKSSEQL
jgi:replication factor C subunit 2/4